MNPWIYIHGLVVLELRGFDLSSFDPCGFERFFSNIFANLSRIHFRFEPCIKKLNLKWARAKLPRVASKMTPSLAFSSEVASSGFEWLRGALF